MHLRTWQAALCLRSGNSAAIAIPAGATSATPTATLVATAAISCYKLPFMDIMRLRRRS